jgi:phosphate starvation-inducible PhoH-like protein
MIASEETPNAPIEVAPVGTMRGRTFKKAFVIIDEAQNLKDEELKMVLTRLGPGSKIVITGDPQQIDLDPKSASGLMRFVEALKDVEGVAVHQYGAKDVMRHPTVKRIVDRLNELEEKTLKIQSVAGTPRP